MATNGILSPKMRMKLLTIRELNILPLIEVMFDGETRSKISATALNSMTLQII